MDHYLRMERVRFIVRSITTTALLVAAWWILPTPLELWALFFWLFAMLTLLVHHNPESERWRAWHAFDRATRRGRSYR